MAWRGPEAGRLVLLSTQLEGGTRHPGRDPGPKRLRPESRATIRVSGSLLASRPSDPPSPLPRSRREDRVDIPTPAKKYAAEITIKCSSNYASARRITDSDMRPQQAGGQTSRTICYVPLIGNVLGHKWRQWWRDERDENAVVFPAFCRPGHAAVAVGGVQ